MQSVSLPPGRGGSPSIGGKTNSPTGGATSGAGGHSATGVRSKYADAASSTAATVAERGQVGVERRLHARALAHQLGHVWRQLVDAAGHDGHERRPELVVEDRVVGPAQLGGARRALLDDLDAGRGQRAGGPPDRLPARAADGLQAVVLEDGDARDGRGRGAALADDPEREVEVGGVARHRADAAEHLHARGRRSGSCAIRGIASRPQRRPKTPVQCAGVRIEPPRSLPIPSGLIAAARAAASPPGRAARRPPRVVRVAGRAVDAVDRVPEAAELGHVRLAEQDRSRGAQAADHDRVGVGDARLDEQRAVARRHPRDRHDLLHGEGHAVQRPGVLAARQRRVGPRRLGARLVDPRQDDRVDLAVALGDPRGVGLDQFDRTHLALTDRARHPCRRALDERVHDRPSICRARE